MFYSYEMSRKENEYETLRKTLVSVAKIGLME